ncbi:MAG: hypothetical protein AB8G05_18180 [Oligoflexales bacterium]
MKKFSYILLSGLAIAPKVIFCSEELGSNTLELGPKLPCLSSFSLHRSRPSLPPRLNRMNRTSEDRYVFDVNFLRTIGFMTPISMFSTPLATNRTFTYCEQPTVNNCINGHKEENMEKKIDRKPIPRSNYSLEGFFLETPKELFVKKEECLENSLDAILNHPDSEVDFNSANILESLFMEIRDKNYEHAILSIKDLQAELTLVLEGKEQNLEFKSLVAAMKNNLDILEREIGIIEGFK